MRGVRMRPYRPVIASLIIGGLAVAVIVSGASHVSESTAITESKLRAELAATVKFAPVSGATAVSPNAPIVVKVGRGHLVAVRVTSPNRSAVGGTLDPSAREWRSQGSLAYGTVYT